jgi:plastocyanin
MVSLRMNAPIKRLLILAASITALTACGDDDGAGPDNRPPAIDTVFTPSLNDFAPTEVTIRVGGTVVWSFGFDLHNVIFIRPPSGPQPPQDIPSTMNQNVSRVFPLAGTFDYECRLHPGMNGTVIVK